MLLRWWNWSVFLRLQQGHWIVQWNSPLSWQGRRRSNNLSSVGLDLYGGLIDIPWMTWGFTISRLVSPDFVSDGEHLSMTFFRLRMQKEPWASSHSNLKFGFQKNTTTCWTQTQPQSILFEAAPCLYFGRCLVGSGPVSCCQPLKLRLFILSLVWRKTASHKCWMSGSLSQMVHRFQPKRYD